MKRKFNVDVIHSVEVVIDDEFINDEFIEEYRKHFSDLDSIEEHAEHIAQMKTRQTFSYVRTNQSYIPKEFYEGYGILSDIGCDVTEISVDPESAEEAGK